MRGLIVPLIALLPVNRSSAQVPPDAGPPAVIETTTGPRSAELAVVALNAGRTAGVRLADQFWVFSGAGTENAASVKSNAGIAGRGVIYFVTDAESVGRLNDPVGELAAGLPAAILPHRVLPQLRDRLPPGVTIRGPLARVPPGRRTAWLDLGRRAGLRLQDDVLIRRKIRGNEIPIARGRVRIIQDDLALTTLWPLVGNALPQAGDYAELWPEPAHRRWGRVNSAVLAVQPDDEGAVVTIVGTAADGFEQGRLVDLYRDGRYVGVAPIIRTSYPLSEARLIAAASPLTPEVGDEAVLRAGPDQPAAPLSAVIFRVEGDYCLLAAGESDGVQVGEKFIVHRRDPGDAAVGHVIAELTVTTVKVEHAGADVRPLAADGPRVARWDLAERRIGKSARWRPIGIVEDVAPDSRAAVVDLDPQCGITRGQVVRWVPHADQPPGAAIIARRAGPQALIYVPPGWGNTGDLHRARVEAPDHSLAPTPPATRPTPVAPAGPAR